MAQAIVTKYLAPTNHRGSRIVATCDAGTRTIAWDYAADVTTNHDRAAELLRAALGWPGAWIGATLPHANPAARVYVRVAP